MGYNERGDFVGVGKGDAHHTFYDHQNSSSGNNNSGGDGCIVALLVVAGSLISASYGVYEVLAMIIW